MPEKVDLRRKNDQQKIRILLLSPPILHDIKLQLASLCLVGAALGSTCNTVRLAHMVGPTLVLPPPISSDFFIESYFDFRSSLAIVKLELQ